MTTSIAPAAEMFGLFPVPLLRVRAALPQDLVRALVAHFERAPLTANNASDHLSHSEMLRPGDSPLFGQAVEKMSPWIVDFGAQLFAERIGWSVKEMWVNLLDTGGRQAMHNHANSFVSGVVYLSEAHTSARTVFMKSPGGTDFAFRHDHAGVEPTPYSAEKWVSPISEPGDLLLFPSYLMHAVPPNQGGRRVSLAFNAIPTHLDSWGYRVSFSG